MDKKYEDVKITLRISADIANMMKRLARENDRSLNGELVRAIREYIARQQKQAGEKRAIEP
ncbi:MAG: hypothetical protein OJF49_004507 [Ktedonobacterales bacterium]|jgi:predicted transcriptional regulator|nr:MAG: hypothetical protein OJF49_004507 [Ktedonobacterales bacterium]